LVAQIGEGIKNSEDVFFRLWFLFLWQRLRSCH